MKKIIKAMDKLFKSNPDIELTVRIENNDIEFILFKPHNEPGWVSFDTEKELLDYLEDK